ncbi:MAG TPA: thioredoxin family protein [Solimonas sp.]|nr:thioredoxin family protein [Solimonas sp.]
MNIALSESTLANHPVVSHDQWLAERKTLLQREKELTRLRDQLARERRALPWRRLAKDYVFDTHEGRRSLAKLFEGRRQLVVQHFMLAPGWPQGCPSCSYMADHIDGAQAHVQQRDITLLVVSRAPLAEIEHFRQRMGWQFRWVSSHGSDFNRDFGVTFLPEERAKGEVYYNYGMQHFPQDEAPGISVFCKDDAGEVFHTYSTYGRGVELMMGAYDFIDLTPRGRDEDQLPHPMAWVRHHDRYEAQAPAKPVGAACCGGQA